MMQSTLDFSKSEQYYLSIRLASDGFSFYIADPVGGVDAECHAFAFVKNKTILSQVEDLFYHHEQLVLPYRRTSLVVVSSDYSFVPNDLYREGKQAHLLSFEFDSVEEKLLQNTLHREQLTNLFALDKGVYSFLHRSLSINKVWHYTTPLGEYFAERSKFGNYSKMYVNLEPAKLDIFCFERSRLKLVNTIPFRQISDAAYYVLYAWEKTAMHQTDDELHVCGNAELRSLLMPLLSKYVQRVLPLNPPTGWYVAPANNEYLPVDLMTLSLCE